MANSVPPIQFTGKTWIFVVQAVVFGVLGIFSLILGPLFLFEIMKDARGQPAVDAGVALTVTSVPLLCVFALAVFNTVARRRPVLRVCREGLAVNMIGSSSLDAIPLIPWVIRVTWLIVSLQGFKQQTLLAPWQTVHMADVAGPPMARTLTIIASWNRASDGQFPLPVPVANEIAFPEVAFRSPLEQIAHAINGYCQDLESRNDLPSWNG